MSRGLKILEYAQEGECDIYNNSENKNDIKML